MGGARSLAGRVTRLAFAAAVSMAAFGSTVSCAWILGAGDFIDDPNAIGALQPLEDARLAGRLDLLLVIDNSRSMADKQNILIKAVPDLVTGLVNPSCVDADGVAAANQPSSPTQDCATVSGAGFRRRFQPVLDVHIGVITSSLGGHGGDACPGQVEDVCDTEVNFTNDDHGRLVSRADVYAKSTVPTYANKGFLAWDPSQKLSPPGETSLDALDTKLAAIVGGLGQIGCGFESQLEAWYRFLVDPEPYQSIAVVDGNATPKGVDDDLLRQRADFLRPDSLLAIVMLTDENDTSLKEYGHYYLATQLENADKTPFHLPRPRSECAKDPNDPCCKSCGEAQGNCPKDPTCDQGNLDEISDPINLRGWDEKRRFGMDFLYPIDRYASALTQSKIPNRAGELVPNPIFAAPSSPPSAGSREPGQVFLAGIIGVPWQDIARTDGDGRPNLVTGLDSGGKSIGGFKSADELTARDPASGLSRWDVILGAFDGSNYQPKDPLMKEDVNPRTGKNPVTGDDLMPPTSFASAGPANPINGHEHEFDVAGDLQYACIFPLLSGTERDCTKSCIPSCDCVEKMNKNPLCGSNAGDDGNPTKQTRAKAYPGLRELAVLQALGKQGVVGSACPAQLTDPARADFGYRPALNALMEAMTSDIGRTICVPTSLPVDSAGRTACHVLEAVPRSGTCDCHQRGLTDVVPALAERAETIATVAGSCVCEVLQLEGDDLATCRTRHDATPTAADGARIDGYCYVDADRAEPLGDPALVWRCPAEAKRALRFLGLGDGVANARFFLACAGD